MDRVRGTIARRLLVNFRVDPEVARRKMPPGFEPKLVAGYAVAGICLVRLEHERPFPLPRLLGQSSENAAHRFAAFRVDERGVRHECVYIARRHSGSLVNIAVGGRIYPGEHRPAHFAVQETDDAIELSMRGSDGLDVDLRGHAADALPTTSVFATLEQASAFFRAGGLGYSETHAGDVLDALRLDTHRWELAPLEVDMVRSTYFEDRRSFPSGSIELDCALTMTDIEHEWRREPRLRIPVRDN